MFGQGPAVGHEAQHLRIAVGCRLGRDSLTLRLEGTAPDHINHWLPVDWRKGKGHGRFRQPIAWHVALGTKTVRSKAPGKALQRLGEYCLPGVDRHAPAAQVEPLQSIIRDLARAELVGKIRRGTKRAA